MATKKIERWVDMLTGGKWLASYEDSLYDVPSKGGLWDYQMDPANIRIQFSPRDKGDATFSADRIIKYDGTDYSESFIGSVTPDGQIVMNSLTDTDILTGRIDGRSGTITMLFFDDGAASSSLGSQTAVGTFVFSDISKPYTQLPGW